MLEEVRLRAAQPRPSVLTADEGPSSKGVLVGGRPPGAVEVVALVAEVTTHLAQGAAAVVLVARLLPRAVSERQLQLASECQVEGQAEGLPTTAIVYYAIVSHRGQVVPGLGVDETRYWRQTIRRDKSASRRRTRASCRRTNS